MQQMKPEDSRQLLLKPGTPVSLVSADYGGVEWDYDDRLKGSLSSYLVAERHWPKVTWDTACILSLPRPIQASIDSEDYFGSALLLFHRLLDVPWDDYDRIVLVFGIQHQASIGEGPQTLNVWRSKTVLLSYGANLLVEDAPNPSPLTRAFLRRREWKRLKAMLDAGLITEQEYEGKRAEVELQFPY
ncbi:MAG: SHOCT domain-containing protein [Proteobacteria bacterium]|nr:SHOCT domain-containing protein [Pseudomonadota bacterium]